MNRSRNNKPFTVALIGCGKIGFRYDYGKRSGHPFSHFSSFNTLPHFYLKAIAEPDIKTRAVIEKKFRIKTYADPAELLKNERVDVICIASPDDTHERLLQQIVEYTPKLVFCEKPLSLNLDFAEQIVNLYKKNNISLSVNYSRRYIEDFHKIKRLIEKNALGKLQVVTVYYSRGFLHNATHYLDLMLWYFGFPDKIQAQSEREGLYPADPTINFTMAYRSGLEIRFVGIDTSKLIINEMDIIGDKGRLKIDTDGKMTKYSVKKNRVYKEYRSFVADTPVQVRFNKALINAAENIYQHLAYQKPLLSPGENSVALFKLSAKIIHACHAKISI